MAKKKKTSKTKKKATKKRKAKCNLCNQPFFLKDLTEIPFKASPDAPEVTLNACGACLLKTMSSQAAPEGTSQKDPRKSRWDKDEKSYQEYADKVKERRKQAHIKLMDKLGKQISDECPHERVTYEDGGGKCRDCGKKVKRKSIR